MTSSPSTPKAPAGRVPLSRPVVLSAALRIVDQHGIEALSMRRLGKESTFVDGLRPALVPPEVARRLYAEGFAGPPQTTGRGTSPVPSTSGCRGSR